MSNKFFILYKIHFTKYIRVKSSNWNEIPQTFCEENSVSTENCTNEFR